MICVLFFFFSAHVFEPLALAIKIKQNSTPDFPQHVLRFKFFFVLICLALEFICITSRKEYAGDFRR